MNRLWCMPDQCYYTHTSGSYMTQVPVQGPNCHYYLINRKSNLSDVGQCVLYQWRDIIWPWDSIHVFSITFDSGRHFPPCDKYVQVTVLHHSFYSDNLILFAGMQTTYPSLEPFPYHNKVVLIDMSLYKPLFDCALNTSNACELHWVFYPWNGSSTAHSVYI